MDRHICRAKDINTGEWVYGYYVAVSHFGHPEHVIIEEDAQYDGCGEFLGQVEIKNTKIIQTSLRL